MKRFQKTVYFILGMVFMAFLSTTVIPVMAAMVQKQITVSTGVNIYVDDEKMHPVDANGNPVEVFIYNGTTYLPARAVSTAVGKPISWDGKTQTIYIGKHDSEEPVATLNDLVYFNRDGNEFKKLQNAKDSLGKSYTNGITIYNRSGTGNAGSSWEEYNINGAYSRMKGRIILNYDLRDSSNIGQFRVYGDNVLIYTSPEITKGVDPINFDIDLVGVLKLKVEFHPISEDLIWGPHNINFSIVDSGLYQ